MPIPPVEYDPYVKKARSLLIAEGLTGRLDYLNATKTEVDGQQLVDVILWNNGLVRYQIFLTENGDKRVFSPWEKEARRLCTFLPKLGWKAPIRIASEPDGWSELPKQQLEASFIDASNENVLVSVDLQDHRIVRISAGETDFGGVYHLYDPKPEESAAAEKYLNGLGVFNGNDEHPAKKEDGSSFTRLVPLKTHPFEIQIGARLLIDSKSLRIRSFVAPTKKQLEQASTITPLAEDYLSAARSLKSDIGETKGRAFARAKIKIGNAASRDLLNLEVSGWISADHSKITALDGVEYSVSEYISKTNLAENLTDDLRFSMDGLLCNNITQVLPILLINAGETDLAERLYNKMSVQSRSNLAYGLCTSLSTSYRMLVADNLKRGQFRDALGWSQRLIDVETERVRHPRPDMYSEGNKPGLDLAEAISINKDLERRLQESRKRTRPNTTYALIQSLDNLTTAQNTQPGEIYFNYDPAVIRLEARGTSAVKELIEAIRSDDRFTRAISFGRDFFPTRTFHTTREVEILALKQIWPSCPNEDWSKPQLAADAVAVTWKQLANMSEPDRMIKFLQSNNWQTRRIGEAFLTSEKLRKEFEETHRSEIKNLLTRNVLEESSSLPNTVKGLWAASSALLSAHSLALWQGADSLPILRSASLTILDFCDHYAGSPIDLGPLSGNFGQLTSDRIKLGDKEVVNDYERMLRHVTVGGLSYQAKFWEQFWDSGENSPISALATTYFGQMESELSANSVNANQFFLSFGTNSGLLKLPAFRHLLVAIIKKDEAFGEVFLNEKGYTSWKSPHGSGSVIVPKGSNFKLKKDESMQISLGDYYSSLFSSSIKHAPRVYLWSSVKDRNLAKSQLSSFLLKTNYNWSSIVNKLPVKRRYEGQGTLEYRGN